MSYNNELERGETEDYNFPLNTQDAYFLQVRLVSTNEDGDGHDLDIFLYYPNGTEANNTDEDDAGVEEIRYDRYGQYRDRLNVLGDWGVTIENDGWRPDTPLEYDLYIDVVYYS
jgi:hypothetical protein